MPASDQEIASANAFILGGAVYRMMIQPNAKELPQTGLTAGMGEFFPEGLNGYVE